MLTGKNGWRINFRGGGYLSFGRASGQSCTLQEQKDVWRINLVMFSAGWGYPDAVLIEVAFVFRENDLNWEERILSSPLISAIAQVLPLLARQNLFKTTFWRSRMWITNGVLVEWRDPTVQGSRASRSYRESKCFCDDMSGQNWGR